MTHRTNAALLEVERIVREILDSFDGAHLTGECDTECGNSDECRKISTVAATCPKCGDKFDVESECDGMLECSSTCTADVEVDLQDEDTERLRCLRLALVALDLARTYDGES